MPKSFTMDIKEKFIELRAKGHTFIEISEQLRVSKPTLIEWSKEFQNEIENSKALEMEALQERYYASWKRRLEFIGKEFARLKEELEKRDFSDMSTKELYEVALKFQQQLGSLQKKGSLKVQYNLDEELSKMASGYSTIDI